MFVKRNVSLTMVLRFAWAYLLFFAVWGFLAVLLVDIAEHHGMILHIPYLPLGTIGIAVAFYIGFKNNSSYDRFWEARKIWGATINYSRTWGNQVMNFVTRHRAKEIFSDKELAEVQRDLIHRHIAWVYALKLHLRKENPQRAKNLKAAEKVFSISGPTQGDWDREVGALLSKKEYAYLKTKKNIPTHLIRLQGNQLRELMEEKGLIEDFRHMEMMRVLEEFYNFQGKSERIKNTPLPRQYASFSKIFTWIFVLLLPFGMVGEFAKLGHSFMYLTVPFSVLISWIFMTMELVGDNSEDPFDNMINDVPLHALCRTIEIDLREMLEEDNLPEKVKPVNGVLM